MIVFTIIHVILDILSWYESMPRSQKVAAMNLAQNTGHQAKNLTRIDQYYASSHCILCRKLCDHCKYAELYVLGCGLSFLFLVFNSSL